MREFKGAIVRTVLTTDAPAVDLLPGVARGMRQVAVGGDAADPSSPTLDGGRLLPGPGHRLRGRWWVGIAVVALLALLGGLIALLRV